METKVVLEGITIGGKTLREHLEVVNHKDAILYIEDIVKIKNLFQNGKQRIFTTLYLKALMIDMRGIIEISKFL